MEDVWFEIINRLDSDTIDLCMSVNKMFNDICMNRISPLKLKRYDVKDKKYFKYFTSDNKIKGKILCKSKKEASRKAPLLIVKKMNVKDTIDLTYEFCILSYKSQITKYISKRKLLANPNIRSYNTNAYH